jgi:YVTN family beta-propeller protein
VWSAALSQEPAPVEPPRGPLHLKTVEQGLALDVVIEPAKPAKDGSRPLLQQGQAVNLQFSITDTTSGAPITGGHPAAWMDVRAPGETRTSEGCVQKLKTFLGGGLGASAETDLNVFYVLAMNEDATISVIDPLFGFSGSRLLALIRLPSPAYDWVLDADEARLYVSTPDSNQVVVVDTKTWEIVATLEVALHPRRLTLQPDQHYLWVASEASGPDAEDSGVSVFDTSTLKLAARIVTGPGEHLIEVSQDNAFAFVTNGSADNLSVINVRTLRKVTDVKTGAQPSSMAYSPQAGAVYVAHKGDGQIVAVDAVRHSVIARVPTSPGLGQIRFAPGYRYAFAVHPARNEVYILDSATNRIVQTADVTKMAKQPDQVSFTEKLAFIRSSASDQVLTISLSQIGSPDLPVEVADFTGGQNPPGAMSTFTPASGIVQVPGELAVIVSNPKDKSIYFHKEGMAAPMGTLSNAGKEPRAVLVVDRSLREKKRPGVYETGVVLGRPGVYDLVFLLENPRLIHCFELSVAPDLELMKKALAGKVDIQFAEGPRVVKPGQKFDVAFRISDKMSKSPREAVPDVRVLVYLAPGLWQQRENAVETNQPGVYKASLTLPRNGVYYVHVYSRSLGLDVSGGQYLILQAAGEP